MASAFVKDFTRSITHSIGRFLAIMAIVALGCGFFAGIRMTSPDMDAAADSYFDGTDMMDIRVVSTMGLTEGDLDALSAVSGVGAVMGAYESDVIAIIDGEQYAVRMHSLPESARDSVVSADGALVTSEDESYLNRLVLDRGRWPEKTGECVISADRVMNTDVEIGDTVIASEGTTALDDVLEVTEFTIVGFAHSPYYVASSSMGTTSLGTGTITQFMYVVPETFAADLPYTEAFLLVDGAKELNSATDAYDERIAEVTDAISAIAPEREKIRFDEVKSEAREEIDQAEADYHAERADAEAELADAKSALDDALATIEENERSLADGERSYNEGVAELRTQRAQANEKFAQAEEQITASEEELAQKQSSLEQAASQLSASWQQAGLTPADAPIALERARAGVDQASAALAQLEAMLASNPEDPELLAQVEAARAQLAELQAQAAAIEQLIAAQQQYDENKAAFDAAYPQAIAQIEQARNQLAAQREEAARQFAAAEQTLSSSSIQLVDARAQLDQARQDYSQGLADYESAAEEAQAKFADAEADIAEAQSQIDELEEPEWLIMDRTRNNGAVMFSSDAERISNIARVFPLIFFLVAALVALTTMTRMVEEERTLIGTYKALGYSQTRIASKYLLYALIASGVGSIIGIAVLTQVLPWVIMYAYSIIYHVPHGALPIDWQVAIIAASLGIGITLLSTWAAVAATLRTSPAALMLPQAPKAGRRILLERIKPLWRRMSFLWKVCARNLFRYKKRFIMTVIGIAGCTALLLTGLGLQNSLDDIINKQYGELVRYNVVISTEEDISESDKQELDTLINDERYLATHTTAHASSMVALGSEDQELSVTLMVPSDEATFQTLWKIRDRKTNDEVNLADDGVVISEKMSYKLDVYPGDTLRLSVPDARGNVTGEVYEFKVDALMENYVANYVFISPEAYTRAFGEAPIESSIYATIAEDKTLRDEFSSLALGIDGVRTVAYTDETIDTYRTLLSSVNLVVIVLVVAAALLAFIVLYNLTNINITERIREIATLKVLGFTKREVALYIFREILLLVLIGALFGLALGVILETSVITTAEVDYVMFGREIHLSSYLEAYALTVFFSLIVMVAMLRKLSHVDMVESLKSNE